MARRFYRLKSFDAIEESYQKRLKKLEDTQQATGAALTNLLADLAEANAGLALQAFGQTEILAALTPNQGKATRDKIAVKYPALPSKSTPLQRFLKRSGSERRSRIISPFSKLTITEWIENRINEGTLDGLRGAMQVDPTNARLIAHFGLTLAKLAAAEKADPDDRPVDVLGPLHLVTK